MADYLRLRQICLVAPRLEPLIDDMRAIFELEVCYRDPAPRPHLRDRVHIQVANLRLIVQDCVQ
jgi:hypothetical protein